MRPKGTSSTRSTDSTVCARSGVDPKEREVQPMTTTTKTIRCGYEQDDPGPHPGCSEFDPDPGIIRCDRRATLMLTVQGQPGPNDDGTWDAFFCDEHANVALDQQDPGQTITHVEAIARPLTVGDLKALAYIKEAVRLGSRVRWQNDYGDILDGVARAFTHDGGGFLNHDTDDVRDHYVHVSGMMEYWLPVIHIVGLIRDGLFVADAVGQ